MLREMNKGSIVDYQGAVYIVENVNPSVNKSPISIELKKINDSSIIKVDYNDFLRDGQIIAAAPKASEDEKNETPIVDTLTPKKKEKLAVKYNLVKTVEDYGRAKRNGTLESYVNVDYRELFPKGTDTTKLTQQMVIEALARRYDKSVRSIQYYLQKFREIKEQGFDGREGLVDRAGEGHMERKDIYYIAIKDRRKNGKVIDYIKTRLGPDVAEIISEQITRGYLNRHRNDKKQVIDIIQGICGKKEGVSVPSTDTLYKMLNRIDEVKARRLRESAGKLQQIEDTNRGSSDEQALYPLSIVEIDHTRLDLDVIDEETGFVIGRPWVTLAIDVYSRCIWGMYISFDPPSKKVLLKTLLHGVFKKNTKDQFGTVNEWDVYGKPDIIYVDNGSDFKSSEFKRLVKEVFGSNLRNRPVHTPQYGAVIERLFGSFNSALYHRMPGTRKSNPSKLGDIDPREYACYTLEEVISYTTRYITDVYHFKPHGGLPDYCNFPMARYKQGIELISGEVRCVAPENEPAFRMEMRPQKMRGYTRDGVSLDGVKYKTPSLCDLNKRGEEYIVKYDDDDISYIHLLDPRTNEYVFVPAVNPPADICAGWNRYYYDWVKKRAKAEGKKLTEMFSGAKTWMAAHADLQLEISRDYGKKRQETIKATRAGQGPNNTAVEQDPSSDILKGIEEAEKNWEEENEG